MNAQRTFSWIALAILGIASAAYANTIKHNHLHLATLLSHNAAEDGFTHAAYLDINSTVLLKWSVKSVMSTTPNKPDVLVAELTAPTRGYVAFGLSPNGGMVGANMLVMWVDSTTGRAHVQDRYATAFAEPLVNDDQTAALIAFEGHENATHTTVKFSRWLNAGCRSKHDMSITDSAIRVIFAYGAEDPDAEGHIKYHGTENRGSQALYLIDDVNGNFEHDKAAAEAQTTQIVTYTANNFSVPAIDTYYRCEVFELPENEEDMHIIGFEPILQHSNLDILHHFLVHDCPTLHELPKLKSFECYHTPPELLNEQVIDCFSSIKWAWAVGGTSTYMPQNVGLPLTASKGTKRYMLMETHYNNPALVAGRLDNSGFRMLLTNKLRPTRASAFGMTSPANEALIIPGNTDTFIIPNVCPEECTNKYLPAQGTTVFNVLLHSHLIGRSLALRHFRDGVELPAIASDQSYDFNYQQWRPVNVTILPGDKFVMECNYSSTTPELRKNSTLGGFSTHEEMCVAILMVTPEVDMKLCMSQPNYDKLKVVLKFDDIPPPTNNATFDERTKYGKIVTARLKAIDWATNATMQSQLVDLYLHNPHSWSCASGPTDYLNGAGQLMPTWEPFSPPNECKNTQF